MSNYKVAVLSGEGQFEIKELELKQPVGKQVLIKVDSCAICTLEQRVYKGMMKYYPFAGGHEVSGTVVSVGEDVKNVAQGDKVAARLLTNCGECYYCRNGHENLCEISFKASTHEGLNGPGGLSEYMTVDAKSVFKLSDDLDLSYAALSEPLACCVHSIGQGNINLGDDVVVIGAGIMGAFHVMLAKLRGARVIVCELDEDRLSTAKALGADVLINSGKTDVSEEILKLTNGRGADVVFCTAALPKLADQAISLTGKTGRTVMYSSFHPKEPISLDVNRVHYSEMVITGSVNPLLKDFQMSTRLLSGGLINPQPLISASFPFEKISEAFEAAVDPKTYRVLVKMN
ncbi:MAG: alcohol dehydrogenase catalytic domain-containing protein [Lachnospiraceae bacterium]|nr:alcohol dehydrogenase catalytic domain-containing protein [Lachnospiraceae bacterium]